jgi:N-acyl-D-amino-acid deacylase
VGARVASAAVKSPILAWSLPLTDLWWGQALLKRGQPAAAIEKFMLASKKGPKFADPLEGWGAALMAKNQSHLALVKFAEAEKYAPNWGRLHLKWGEALLFAGRREEAAKIEAARAAGTRITANMYVYPASATGLDAAMPPWVQDGGLEKWIERLKDPAIRKRVIAEMRNPHPKDWDSAYGAAGASGVLFLNFKNSKLKPLIGKTLSEVAQMRGKSPEETAMDLVAEDSSRVDVAYFLMSEDNIRREVALPWMSFDSDESAPSNEGLFLKSSYHPRAFGNFARVLAKYVRDERAVSLPEAIRRLTSFPAETLSLKDRGRIKAGFAADIVVFDPTTIQDHATFEKPMQYATGIIDVVVNGKLSLENGKLTSARPGRFVHGRAWIGQPGGGCRASSRAWTWMK